jgi:hypothetical protein
MNLREIHIAGKYELFDTCGPARYNKHSAWAPHLGAAIAQKACDAKNYFPGFKKGGSQ